MGGEVMDENNSLPFDNFECDKCGACCRSLLVHAYDYDARREPKLYTIGNVNRKKMRDEDAVIFLYDKETKACPFLNEDNECGIYQTRPLECVMVEPGDAKCQQARVFAGLPLLRDRDGEEPTVGVLRESCEEYGLDIKEYFEDMFEKI